MATLEQVKQGTAISKKDSTRGIFRDGVSETRGDIGNRKDRLLARKEATIAQNVEGTPSKEYNSFNHLNHLNPTCSYKIEYYITAGILTQAASILRKSAYEDVSKIIAGLEKEIERIKKIADDKLQAQITETLKKGGLASKNISTNIKEKATSNFLYDILNIPWKLRVPKSSDTVLKTVASMQSSSLTEIETKLSGEDLLEDHVGNMSLTLAAGRQMFACPEKVTSQGFMHLGSYTKPLFLPIIPATAYSGLFGKILSELKTSSGTNKTNDFSKINAVTALASCRLCVPPTIAEDGNTIPIIAPMIADYASIVSPGLVYNKDKISQISTAETAKGSVALDNEWKKIINNGELFDLGTADNYTAVGLVENEIIKHGTVGLTTADLDQRIGAKKTNFVVPFLARMALEDNAAKAGQAAPAEPSDIKSKSLEDMNNYKVSSAIKAKPWGSVVADRYAAPTTVANIKAGKGLYSLTDIPSFHFWTPFITSKAEDNDGSNIYSYLEPTSDDSLHAMEVIYSVQPPVAYLKMGVTYIPYSEYMRAQWELNQDPGVALDDIILNYGLGGFSKSNSSVYMLPASRLVNAVFQSTTGLFSSSSFPKTHKFGQTKVSLHSAVMQDLLNTFSRFSYDSIKSLTNVIPLSVLKNRSASGNVKDLTFGMNDIGLFGTSMETVGSADKIAVFSSEKKSPSNNSETDGTYTTGSMRKVSLVQTAGLISAEIHFGKTLNVKGLEDNITLDNNGIKKLLIDSTIETTPIISTAASKKVFITDIQPGEVLHQKFNKNDKDNIDPNGFTPVNQIEYSSDSSIGQTALYTEDLIDSQALTRISSLDFIGAFVGNKDKPADIKNLSKEGKPISNDISGILVKSAFANVYALLGADNIVPSLSTGYRPLGKQGEFFSAGDMYNYKGANEKGVGLLGSLAALLKSPEILFLEHFEDVKFYKEASKSLVFYSKTNEGSGEYDLINITKSFPRYIDFNETNTLTVVSPAAFTSVSKDTEILFPNTESKLLAGNVSFDPWVGFSAGTETYTNRLDKLSFLTTSESEQLSGKSAFYNALDSFVTDLVKEIHDRASQIPNHVTNIFELGTFKIEYTTSPTGNNESNIVSVFTSLINFMKFENIAAEYPGLDVEFINTLFSSLSKKLNAAAVYTVVDHLKKANAKIDAKLKKLLTTIKTNRTELEPLLVGKQVIDATTLGALRDVLPLTMEVVRNPEEDSFIVADFPLVNILVEAIASFYILTLVYKKGFSEDRDRSTITNRLTDLNNYYSAIKGNNNQVFISPRYDTESLADLGVLIKYATNSRDGFTNPAPEIKKVFENVVAQFGQWWVQKEGSSLFSTNPPLEIAIPKTGSLILPVCIGRFIDDLNDGYSRQKQVITFADSSTSELLSNDVLNSEDLPGFADKCISGEYFLIVKKVHQTWVGNTAITGKVDLTRISLTARNAALMSNIIDYIGFAFQSLIEVAKAVNLTKPIEQAGTDSRETNKSNRKLKLEFAASYVEDITKDKGAGTGERAYIIELNDFSNMVRVESTSTQPIIKHMYPVKLKKINPDDPNPSLAPKDLIETLSYNLVDFFTPEKTKYAGFFMRPGYGFPDLVKDIGYRCLIKNVKQIMYGTYAPKRFAFHGNFSKDDASLRLSRMLQNAIGENWDKVIKANEWTKKIVDGKQTNVNGQIFSVTIPAKYRSQYDNFNPSGISGAAVFDINIGYISTRPLFRGQLDIPIPNKKIEFALSGLDIPISFSWKSGFPINFLYRLNNDIDTNKQIIKTNEFKNKLVDDTKLFVAASILSKTPVSTVNKSLKSDPDLTDSFLQLSTFGAVKIMTADDVKAVSTGKTEKVYITFKSVVIDLINKEMLWDTTNAKATQLTFTGRTFDVSTVGSAPYPVIKPGLSTLAELKKPELKNYDSITATGRLDESLYDLHPLSFLTSPSLVGLSKRRALFVGLASIAKILEKFDFIKNPDAKNPYSGFYVYHNKQSYSRIVATQNKRKFEGTADSNPTVTVVYYVPDFDEQELSSKDLAIKGLSVSKSENISDDAFVKYYGTGTLLNGEFVTKSETNSSFGNLPNFIKNIGKREQRYTPTDALGNSSTKYKKEYFDTLLKHLKLWNTYAVGEDVDYYNALNGCFFNLNSKNAAANRKNITIAQTNSLSSSIFKTENQNLSESEIKKLQTIIDTLFSKFGMSPVCLESNILYFTGSAVSYLWVLAYNTVKEGGDKDLPTSITKSNIRNLLTKLKDSDAIKQIEVTHFANIDMFSILAGSRFPSTGADRERFSLNQQLQATDKFSKTGPYDKESKTFQGSQTYMGFSQDKDSKDVMIAVAKASKGESGKSLLCATRTFGKNIKLKDLFTTDIPYRYMVTESKILLDDKGKQVGEKPVPTSVVKDTGKSLLFNDDAVNIFKFARLWLAHNWYSDKFGDSKILIGDTLKSINSATLEDYTAVQTEYFVKKIGPKLKSIYSAATIQPTFEILDSSISPFSDGVLLTPAFPVTASGKISAAPFYGVTNTVLGPGGIYNKEVSKNDIGPVWKGNRKQSSTEPKEIHIDSRFAAVLWSLFSIKAFVGTTNLGLNPKDEELLDTDPIQGALEVDKTTIGAISLTNNKIYTDLLAWDTFSKQDKPGYYTTQFNLQGDKWSVSTANNKPVEFSSTPSSETTYDGKVPQKSKEVASQNGLSVVVFN